MTGASVLLLGEPVRFILRRRVLGSGAMESYPGPPRPNCPEMGMLARMKALRIGCSGWSYKDWRGGFYPEGLPQRRWLAPYFNNDWKAFAPADAVELAG